MTPADSAWSIPGWTPVGQPVSTRRRVVLAGRVRDAVTNAPIAGAVVETVGGTARTSSRADGLFWFFGPLADAATVTLRVSAPHLGTRYGSVERSVPLAATLPATWETAGDVALPPTRLAGTVTDPQGKAIVGAQVRLCGDTQGVLTNAQGAYMLMPRVVSQPTVEVSAPQFTSTRTALAAPLRVGEATIVNVTLTPASAS